ncbi:MAG: ABC transporter permease [Opitutaceae bacterium]|nr:ABC transporter permease [Opitutaceae bacterium]
MQDNDAPPASDAADAADAAADAGGVGSVGVVVGGVVAAGGDVGGGRGVSPWLDAWLRLRKNRLAMAGLVTLALLVLPCLFGPAFSPYDYMEQNLDLGAAAPGAAHWLGTDDLGRDQLVRILTGGRISLMVGLCATVVALVIGITYGAVAGYRGGRLDAAMMRAVDIIYSFPFPIFVILLMTFFGRNIYLLFAAIGAVEWLTMARIVRSQVMAVKRMEFVEAARALGFGRGRIIFRHILPNILGPIVVYITLTIPSVMLLEAFLSFLGLGVQPPMSSWGTLIKEGAEKMEEYWWLLAIPGFVFSLTLLSLNFLGDGLRDALDVRSSRD